MANTRGGYLFSTGRQPACREDVSAARRFVIHHPICTLSASSHYRLSLSRKPTFRQTSDLYLFLDIIVVIDNSTHSYFRFHIKKLQGLGHVYHAVALPCTIGAIALAIFDIYRHLLNYTEPTYQRFIVRIFFMVPDVRSLLAAYDEGREEVDMGASHQPITQGSSESEIRWCRRML